MDLLFIVIIIVLIFLIGLFFSLVKNLVKTLLFTAGIIIVLSFILGIFFYLDFRSFSKDIYEKDKLFLLEDNNEIAIGMKVGKLDEDAFKAEHNFIAPNKLEEYSNLYKENDYKEIRGNYFKLFIFKNKAFNIALEDKAFADFLEKNIKEESYIFILKELKKGNIIICPKTLLFKVAEISPISLIDKLKKRFTNA